jgi:hypothetical protein
MSSISLRNKASISFFLAALSTSLDSQAAARKERRSSSCCGCDRTDLIASEYAIPEYGREGAEGSSIGDGIIIGFPEVVGVKLEAPRPPPRDKFSPLTVLRRISWEDIGGGECRVTSGATVVDTDVALFAGIT